MKRNRYLSDEELAAFLEAVRAHHHSSAPRSLALFALLANTGLRPAEALAIRVEDLHLGAGVPWIRVVRLKKRATTPTVDELCVPEVVVSPMLDYIGLAGLREGRVFPFSRRAAHRMFRFYAARAGIGALPLYCLRHTAATRLHRYSRDIRLVQRLLGHDSPDTTAIYVHIGREQQQAAVAAMGAVT